MKYIYITLFFYFFIFTSFGQTKLERKKIIANYDLTKLKSLESQYNQEFLKRKIKIEEYLKINNISLTKTIDNVFMSIYDIVNGKPIYLKTFNRGAAISTRANFLHNNGGLGLNIEGQNMIAFVWDGGIAKDNHMELMVGGSSKISFADNATTVSSHATHVIGTMIAQGVNSNAKGMAPRATAYSLDWFNDAAEVAGAASIGMLISNHSYGPNLQDLSDWSIGAYVAESKTWDDILYAAPYYLLVCAAGNDGNDAVSNGSPIEGNNFFDKLSGMATAKNTMVVANANDALISNGNLIGGGAINSSSSKGPTDDYRIKPDITGNGTNIYSCVSSSNTAYDSYTGTSMASPNVAGTLLLLQQLYNQENGNYMYASTLKGLALHTADDKGMSGPDAIYGWGYLNAKKASEIILSATDIIEEKSLSNNQVLSFDVIADGSSDLEVSISWTDPTTNNVNNGNVNNTIPVLVNDLDIRVSKNGSTYFPWKLTSVNSNTTGDNIVDPFEKIKINNASGQYTITVSHKGVLNSNQNYSLIVSGITSSNLNVKANQIKNVFVWPNPTKNYINIKLDDFKNTNIKIFTLMGEEIFMKNYNLNSESLKLNLNYLSTGVYILEINKNQRKFNQKIIIK